MLSAFAPMTMNDGVEGAEGAGLQGYAFVGTIPVTEDPEGPRIWVGSISEGSTGVGDGTHLALAVILGYNPLH